MGGGGECIILNVANRNKFFQSNKLQLFSNLKTHIVRVQESVKDKTSEIK